jgi:DNA-binding NtrC family response regulator
MLKREPDMNDTDNHVHVLAVSPLESDHVILSRILGHSTWTMQSAYSLKEACSNLKVHHAHVVVCEKSLSDGDWRDLLEFAAGLDDPPQVIVMARNADDRLWGEVLNRGAWDVLSKPFHPQEVYQSVHLAWRHWQDACRTRERTIAAPRRPVASVSDRPVHAAVR